VGASIRETILLGTLCNTDNVTMAPHGGRPYKFMTLER
jgi:hypothetical protein